MTGFTEEMLARARAVGVTGADLHMSEDLAKHAATQAAITIETIAETLPSPRLAMAVRISAILSLFSAARQVSGPAGAVLFNEFLQKELGR